MFLFQCQATLINTPFRQDIRKFVTVLVSFIFASEEQMGYDPSVQRRRDPNHFPPRICWVYSIEESESSARYFKTCRTLSEFHDSSITGRSTRVLEVVEVASPDDLRLVPGAHPMVLKDAW
jgi:hypothetical protein